MVFFSISKKLCAYKNVHYSANSGYHNLERKGVNAMGESVKKFVAGQILRALWDSRKERTSAEAAKRLYGTYIHVGTDGHPYEITEKSESSERIITACLEKMKTAMKDPWAYDGDFHFAVVCNIETNSSELFDFNKMYLTRGGNSTRPEIYLPLLTLAEYLRAEGTFDGGVSSDVLWPMFKPYSPTANTQNKYKNDVLTTINDFFDILRKDIPYLEEEPLSALQTEAIQTMEGLLRGAESEDVEEVYSFIPLQTFSRKLNKDEKSLYGTEIHLTLGIFMP